MGIVRPHYTFQRTDADPIGHRSQMFLQQKTFSSTNMPHDRLKYQVPRASPDRLAYIAIQKGSVINRSRWTVTLSNP